MVVVVVVVVVAAVVAINPIGWLIVLQRLCFTDVFRDRFTEIVLYGVILRPICWSH